MSVVGCLSNPRRVSLCMEMELLLKQGGQELVVWVLVMFLQKMFQLASMMPVRM